jgi:hypothetical protein
MLHSHFFLNVGRADTFLLVLCSTERLTALAMDHRFISDWVHLLLDTEHL